EPTEIQYHLQSHGIPMDLWPVTHTGNVKTANLFQWMRIRKLLESPSPNEMDESVLTGEVIVECPGSSDVLFRSGRSYLNLPGNQKFQELIAVKADEHRAAATNEAKVKITWWIMDQVESAQGRFLEWNANGGYWIVSKDRTKIRNKIAVYIRDFNRQISAAQHRQVTESSTYKFERQDGRKRRRGENGKVTQKGGWSCWGDDDF
ncbi:MAG: hypothetical protein SGILL_008566, partial [Bacillariaceae sp.]